MWLHKFKNIIELRKIPLKEMAEVCGMSYTGFTQSLNAGTFRFEVMMKLLNHYKINYYSINDYEFNCVNEEYTEYEKNIKTDTEKSIMLETLKKNYEERIKKSEEYNEHLRGQITFLQQVIAKNIGLGETTSRTG